MKEKSKSKKTIRCKDSSDSTWHSKTMKRNSRSQTSLVRKWKWKRRSNSSMINPLILMDKVSSKSWTRMMRCSKCKSKKRKRRKRKWMRNRCNNSSNSKTNMTKRRMMMLLKQMKRSNK
jgi:hypothetical protein